jgi:hypothetical protein
MQYDALNSDAPFWWRFIHGPLFSVLHLLAESLLLLLLLLVG